MPETSFFNNCAILRIPCSIATIRASHAFSRCSVVAFIVMLVLFPIDGGGPHVRFFVHFHFGCVFAHLDSVEAAVVVFVDAVLALDANKLFFGFFCFNDGYTGGRLRADAGSDATGGDFCCGSVSCAACLGILESGHAGSFESSGKMSFCFFCFNDGKTGGRLRADAGNDATGGDFCCGPGNCTACLDGLESVRAGNLASWSLSVVFALLLSTLVARVVLNLAIVNYKRMEPLIQKLNLTAG